MIKIWVFYECTAGIEKRHLLAIGGLSIGIGEEGNLSAVQQKRITSSFPVPCILDFINLLMTFEFFFLFRLIDCLLLAAFFYNA